MMAGGGLIETTTVHLLEQQVDLHLTVFEVTRNFGQSSEAAQSGVHKQQSQLTVLQRIHAEPILVLDKLPVNKDIHWNN